MGRTREPQPQETCLHSSNHNPLDLIVASIIEAHSTMREAFHLVLSIPSRTDPVVVHRAARNFASREFSGSQYAMVLHTFETDPDSNPSVHQHVHLTVEAVSFEGIRLNPGKPDLQRWREGFAEALWEHGIEATTTSRIHRTTHERWKVQHLHDRTTQAKRIDRQKRQTHMPRRQQEVMQHYRQVMKTLARSERGDDRQLAVELVHYLQGRGRTPEIGDGGKPVTDKRFSA